MKLSLVINSQCNLCQLLSNYIVSGLHTAQHTISTYVCMLVSTPIDQVSLQDLQSFAVRFSAPHLNGTTAALTSLFLIPVVRPPLPL